MIDDAISTIEEALRANPEEWSSGNTLFCRGELRLKQGHPELAAADFREGYRARTKDEREGLGTQGYYQPRSAARETRPPR
jgi:hypothetical protein